MLIDIGKSGKIRRSVPVKNFKFCQFVARRSREVCQSVAQSNAKFNNRSREKIEIFVDLLQQTPTKCYDLSREKYNEVRSVDAGVGRRFKKHNFPENDNMFCTGASRL